MGKPPSPVRVQAELHPTSASNVHLRDEEVILHELLQLAPRLPVVMLQQVLQGLHVKLDAIAAQMLLRPAAGEVKVPLQGSNPAAQCRPHCQGAHFRSASAGWSWQRPPPGSHPAMRTGQPLLQQLRRPAPSHCVHEA